MGQPHRRRGAEPGTHALNGSWTVGPPPLPVLTGLLTSDAESVQAGDTLTFSLTVWNNASVAFSGELSCTNEAETLFESGGLVLASGSPRTGVSQRLQTDDGIVPVHR